MTPAWILVGIAVATLAAQGIGFIYLTSNHLTHIQAALVGLIKEAKETNTRISHLEGRMERGMERDR